MGMPWVNLLACVVVGWICCALSYVSTYLSVCVMAGLGSSVSGPIDMDVVYPEAEEYYRSQQIGLAKIADAPQAPPAKTEEPNPPASSD